MCVNILIASWLARDGQDSEISKEATMHKTTHIKAFGYEFTYRRTSKDLTKIMRGKAHFSKDYGLVVVDGNKVAIYGTRVKKHFQRICLR